MDDLGQDEAEFDIGFVAMKIHDTKWAAALIDRCEIGLNLA